MIKNYCLSRTGEMKHLPGTFIIAKSPDYCRGFNVVDFDHVSSL